MTELPTTFGKYYLTEKLATGGMAEIYLAKIIGPGGFEKPLVIKQIHPRLSGNNHFVDLFVAEAKMLVTLAHGNIVPVYELGVVEDTYFIAMDFIDGPTLYRLTEIMIHREASMDAALAAWITARILDGLDYAHRKGEGVIHRDVSPRNVMVSRDGEVKLVDFGIAVTLGAAGDGEVAQSAPTGSFPYMSPEQVRREQLSGQTDLFSLGVLFWEMLVGQRLFARAEPEATLDAVLTAPIPPPSSVRSEVPARLDEVVMRALERDRAARWSTAGDMLATLNKYLYSLEDPPGPREAAALVAQFCPPQSRRTPTHAEAEQPAASGPSTAVIPRDGAPRGKPQRQRTFATNVEMKEVLDRATPLFPFDAIADAPIPRPQPAPLAVPGREPPSRATLVIAGLAALALSGAVVYMVITGRERVLRDPEAGVVATAGDAEPAVGDALPPIAADALPPIVGDAMRPIPRPLDAALPANDAAVRDAGDRRADAFSLGRADAGGDAAARGTATLQIGADPWGEIYIDGKLMGRTPRELAVSAGHHAVEIVFPAETPPRKQTFDIDVVNGETRPVQADFKR